MRRAIEYAKEIKRLEIVVLNSHSNYLKRDYSKAINRKKAELKEYCNYKKLDYKEVLKQCHSTL